MDPLTEMIYSVRTDALTTFAKIFPIFASQYFFITLIALCLWTRYRANVFLHLSFLIPFSTLLNLILKAFFAIPRPPSVLHLIPVHDFGFPSGDVQVCTVFWGVLCLHFRNKWLILFSACLIPLIMLSRMYLGVHSISDVCFGLVVGLLTIWVYRLKKVQVVFRQWVSGRMFSCYATALGVVMLYSISRYGHTHPPVGANAIGALIGVCLSFRTAGTYIQNYSVKPTLIEIVPIALYLVVILGIALCPIPWKTRLEPTSLFVAITLKYMILMLFTLALIPKFHAKYVLRVLR